MACTITGDESPADILEALQHHTLATPPRAPGWTAEHVDPLLDALSLVPA